LVSEPYSFTETMKPLRSPLYPLYFEALLKLMIAEGQASMYLEGMMALCSDCQSQRYMMRLKADTDDNVASLAELHTRGAPAIFENAERLERDVAHNLAIYIDAINLSRLSDGGLINVAIKLQDYVATEYRRALDLARLSEMSNGSERLEKMMRAKQSRREGLVALRSERLAQRGYSPAYAG
jgi:hypothetical protein